MASIQIDTVRGGTLYVDGRIFAAGTTELPLEVSLESAESAVEGLKWARVIHDGDRDPVVEPEPEPEPPEPARPVAGEVLVAADHSDPVEATRAERLRDLVEGKVEKTAARTEFKCDECEKTLKTEAALAGHKRFKHTKEAEAE